MTYRPTILERAYELAQATRHLDLRDLERQLKAEGYESVTAHLQGRSIRTKLRALSQAATDAVENDTPPQPLAG